MVQERQLFRLLTMFSYTHAWSKSCRPQTNKMKNQDADYLVVSSALESGIRGSVQLLLELGLVDEAKAITEKFMARWISV